MAEVANRFLCSDLVEVRFDGVRRVANLEEIWTEGACLQLEEDPAPGTSIEFTGGGRSYHGVVARSYWDQIGWFVEVDFDAGCRWRKEDYRPDHFFDPDQLL